MPKQALIAVAVALLGSAVACGDESIDTFEDFSRAGTRQLCEAQVECGELPDVETCLRLEEPAVEGAVAEFEASVAAGRMRFDPALADECLQAVEASLTCRTSEIRPAGFVETCLQVTVGLVPLGGECLLSRECEGEAFCDGAEREETCTPGLCLELPASPAPVGLGEDCSEAPCETGLPCLEGEGGAERCEVPGAVGGRCRGFGTCEFGLVCDAIFVEGTCQRPGQTGEACSFDDAVPCDLVTDYCSTQTGRCEPAGGAGAACNSFEGEGCLAYANCEDDDVCVQLPGDGERCFISCLGELRCENDVCVAPPVESCTGTSAIRVAVERNKRALRDAARGRLPRR